VLDREGKLFILETLMVRPSIPLLANRIRAEVIRARDLQSGDRLPTVRALGREFGVTSSRILHAIIALEESGEVVRRHGSGCYVGKVRKAETGSSVKTLALLVPRHRRHSIVPSLMEGVLSACEDAGFFLQVRETGVNPAQEAAAIKQCTDQGCQALLLYPQERRPDRNDPLETDSPPVPLIVIGDFPGLLHLPRVSFDQEGCGLQMAEALREHGRRRIAFWHVEDDSGHRLAPSSEARYRGLLRSRMLEHLSDWDVTEVSHRPDQPPDQSLAETFLNRWATADPGSRPDCFWALEDVRASMCYRIAARIQICGFQDLTICGADNLQGFHGSEPNDFPTTRPDYRKLSRSIVQLAEASLHQQQVVPTRYLLDLPVVWPDHQKT
jgi:DNA-binding LacI/PurR family transcriptional regulator